MPVLMEISTTAYSEPLHTKKAKQFIEIFVSIVHNKEKKYHRIAGIFVKARGGNMQRRVVITGLGVLASNGIGKENFWNACLAGRSGVRRITRFDASSLPSQIAGEVPDFDPMALGLTEIECQLTDRNTQLSL